MAESTTESNRGLFKNKSIWAIIAANFGLIAYAGSTSLIDSWNYFFLLSYTAVGPVFLAVIQIVYLIWDMFNDPIFGYLSDKPNIFGRMSKKLGRRFPWIVIFMLPFSFSMWLIFAIPGGIPQWAAIIWATFALLLYETCYTIIQTSSGALIPDKFRSERDRKRSTIFNQVMWFVGLMIGIFLPGIFIGSTATKGSLSSAALWLALISFLGMLIMLPGVKETPEMLERNKRIQPKATFKEFFTTLGKLLKNKNFLGYFFATLGMAILQALIVTSVPFIVLYVSGLPPESVVINSMFIQMGYAGAAVLFLPLWILLQKKVPYQKLYKYAFLIIPVALIPFFFVTNIWIFVGGAVVVGIGIGGISVLGARMYWDIIDEACVEAGGRQEGAYSGIFTFLQRIGPLIGTGIISLVHIFTNFVPGTPTVYGDIEPAPLSAQPASAILGIKLIISFIPIVVSLLGFLIFQLIHRLGPDKVQQNVAKLKELNI